MNTKRIRCDLRTIGALILALHAPAWAEGFPGGEREAWGPFFRRPARPVWPRIPRPGLTNQVRRWNEIAIDASGLDHTPVAAGEARVFGEQLGPGRASRAMAIVHIAIFEAVNAIANRYDSYLGTLPRVPLDTSMDAAIAQAAHDTLVAVFPSQAPLISARLDEDLRRIRDGRGKRGGIELGRRAAAGILALRADDGSQHAEPRIGVDFLTSDQPGWWRRDPVSQGPLAMGAHWGEVAPFVMAAPDQFRAPSPPPLESREYTRAYDEVKRLGGDGVITRTTRTADQTRAGIFWAYDGTPSLCAPPRLYNQLANVLAEHARLDAVALARLLALVNVAMADAGVAIWESKYFYQLWRPVTGIREASPGTGPTKAGDGNPATAGDPRFMPLGAPASNLNGPNFTPPFPSYPSGHAGFGGALFEMLRNVLGRDAIPFTFVSDEYNGVTQDNAGVVRPLLPRRFASLSQAEEENGQSRIYLGIHWAFDKTEGIAQGRRVADYVFANAFTPRARSGR